MSLSNLGVLPPIEYPLNMTRRVRTTALLWLALTVLAVATAAAQDPVPAPAPVATTDVGDLVAHGPRAGRRPMAPPAHQRYLVAAPSIGSKPSTGLNAGISSSMAFYAGEPKTTHISSFSAGMKVSQKRQTNVGSRVAIFTSQDRWFLLGDNRMAWTSQNTYDLGTDAPITSGANAKFDSVRLYESAYRSVGHRMFVGGGLNISRHSDVRAGHTSTIAWNNSSYVAYAEANGFSVDSQKSGGTSMGFRFDTRDNAINPERGWLSATTYRTFFKGFLGGDSNWQELSLDVRTYRKIGEQRPAETGVLVPRRPRHGRTRAVLRSTHHRRRRPLGARVQRGTLSRRPPAVRRDGISGHADVERPDRIRRVRQRHHRQRHHGGDEAVRQRRARGRFGMRVLLNKRSKTNLCTDYGWGRGGARGFYLSIQEAF